MEQFITETPAASIIFIFTLVTSLFAFYNDGVFDKLILNPYRVSRGKGVYTLITSGFIHLDVMHLAANMITFFFFAFKLEQTFARNSSWGHLQFVLLYLLSLVLSDMGSIAKYKNNPGYQSLGASGAVCAVVFSFILFYPWAPVYFALPAFIYGPLFLAYCVYASKKSRDNINHDAHFFGALSGLIITILLYPGIIPQFIAQLTGN